VPARGDTVNFSCSGTITLTSGGGGAIALSKDLTIDGTGQAVTISGGGSVGVCAVPSGVRVTLNDLTIAHGLGALTIGGIFNAGPLRVTNRPFSGNSTPSAAASTTLPDNVKATGYPAHSCTLSFTATSDPVIPTRRFAAGWYAHRRLGLSGPEARAARPGANGAS
jgi:hypothetical protein